MRSPALFEGDAGQGEPALGGRRLLPELLPDGQRIRVRRPCALEISALGVSLSGGVTQLRLLPTLHGTDGYFLAGFRRTSAALV